MTEGGPDLGSLHDLIDAFGRQEADGVVERARVQAVEKATAVLADEMARSLLQHARARMGGTAGAGYRGPSVAERPAPAPPAEPAEPPETGQALWVYGVVAGDTAELAQVLARATGVAPDARPAPLEHEGLAAIVSSVPLAEFGEEPLRENLNDVRWLESTARAHEAVLDAAMSVATVVPLRLCTIYRSEDQVGTMLDREREVFAESLRHLDGKTEWGVKLIAEPGALGKAMAGDSEPEQPDVAPGVAYMQSKSREARARDDADRLASEWAERVHGPLRARAAEALLNPLQNPEVSGHTGEMLLNGAYLVDDGEFDAFRDEVHRLAAEFSELGASVELTGPWPPYNFVAGSIEAAR